MHLIHRGPLAPASGVRHRGARIIQGVDSAALAGAFTKGRSASRRLNWYCRRQCALAAAGDFVVFYPWIESASNPADAPSRVAEPGRGGSGPEGPPSVEATEIQLGSPLGRAPPGRRLFLHL